MIETNLQEIRSRVAAAARRAGRSPEDITLIAVSKFQGAALVEEAIATGQRHFGENRVQEAQDKWPPLLEHHPGLTLHCLGALQSNKAAAAVALFHTIHSVDRPKIAAALAKEMTVQGVRRPCFIQVNTGQEPQKAGIAPGDAPDFIRHCRENLDLPVTGLMCVPPVDANAGLHFAYLADLAKREGLPHLSMGMTGDFEMAVEMGSTHIRIGTAIFGARRPV